MVGSEDDARSGVNETDRTGRREAQNPISLQGPADHRIALSILTC